MIIYLEAKTNLSHACIDYITALLPSGEEFSLAWDESEFGVEEGLFTGRYKGVTFNEEYANGKLAVLLGAELTEIQLYTEDMSNSQNPIFEITNVFICDNTTYTEMPADSFGHITVILETDFKVAKEA